MSILQISIAPEAGVTVSAPPHGATFLVDAVYTRAIGDAASTGVADLPNTVQETVRATLDENLRGSFGLADVAPSTSIDLCFLGANGGVRLLKNVSPGAASALAVTLSATEVAAIIAEDPQPIPSAPQVSRRAYFVPVGDHPVPFESSKLQISPLDVSNGGWKNRGLDQIFHADIPITTAVQRSGALTTG